MTKTFWFFQYLHNAQIKGCTVWFSVVSVIFFESCIWCYLSRLSWRRLQSVGGMSCRNVCLYLHIMERDVTQLVALKAPKKYRERRTQQHRLF